MQVRLRDVAPADLALFFEHQRDPVAARVAAFTVKDPEDRAAHAARWAKLLATDTVVAQTILCDERVAGSILKFEDEGKPEVTYWIGRELWGRGIATRALADFLARVTVRPLYARAANDNVGSLRVLEKCGFRRCGEAKGFAPARGTEVEETLFELS